MKYNIQKISIEDKIYPQQLRTINNPPKYLYCIGNIDLLKQQGFAVVGTRRCSSYGRWAAYEVGRQIAECGFVVVSGMAEGIDTRSHQGCIDGGGKTIAVLGTPIDVCFPKSNRDLYDNLAKNHLIISEYASGEKTGPWSFPQRNRIISGLSSAVIVIEGSVKSGSMITANYALDQGKTIYAVPGNINQPNSMGTNYLIRDGAIPITSIDEVPNILGINKTKRYRQIEQNCTKTEIDIINYINNEPGISLELVAFKLDMDLSTLLFLVSALELKGYIRREGSYLYLN